MGNEARSSSKETRGSRVDWEKRKAGSLLLFLAFSSLGTDAHCPQAAGNSPDFQNFQTYGNISPYLFISYCLIQIFYTQHSKKCLGVPSVDKRQGCNRNDNALDA